MDLKFTSIFKVLILFFLFGGNVMAQSKNGSISGVIKTSDGIPASYVSVGLKNTSKTTQTDEKGGFKFKNVPEGTYTIRVSAIGVSTQEKSVTVIANQNNQLDFSIAQSASQLDEVAITGYKTPNRKPVSLGKVAIAPMDLPQSVQIIGTQVIADQQINTLGDALKNANGVALGANRGSVGENFYARGYSLGSNNVMKNGARTTIGGIPDASTLESVEVLKGSSALLYGGVSGGAVVNMVTKKPKFETGGEVSLRSGSNSFYKPIADIYGPISKKLAVRVIGTYENAGSFRDNVDSKKLYVNPSLLYKVSDKTEVLLQGDYLKNNYTPDFGVGTVDNKIVDFGRSSFINSPWAYNKTNTATAQLNVSHVFNDSWKLNIIGALQSYNRNYFGAERPFANAQGIAARTLTRSQQQEFTYNQQINLNGNFKTGFLGHTLLFGADADQSRVKSDGGYYYNNDKKVTSLNYGNVNLLDPGTYFGSGIEPTTTATTNTLANVYRLGTFVQDLISVTDKFKVLAGIRWTFQKTPTTSITNLETGNVTSGTTADKIDKAFSPKVGLVYEPLKTTSIYASYANNFVSNSGTDINLTPLSPSTIDHYEVGVKNDLLKGRLSVNVTWYRINNSNFAQQALVKADGTPNADSNIKEFSGSTASDGLELDLTGTIVKGLNFIAGYAYNYMRYTSTRDVTTITPPTGAPVVLAGIVEGERLVGTTKNTANGTLFYTFQEGTFKNLKLGASAFYTGDRLGGRNTTKNNSSTGIIPLSGFTTFDFSAGYAWRKVSLLAKVSNITNELNYFVHENYSVNPIAPRQFMTTLSYKF